MKEIYDAFVICPVRGISTEEKASIDKMVEDAEANGNRLYLPYRDTNQEDSVGYRICQDNKRAIELSREVWIWYNQDSQGSLFDLGIAFALNKPLMILNQFTLTEGKSFINMIDEWETRTTPAQKVARRLKSALQPFVGEKLDEEAKQKIKEKISQVIGTLIMD